MLLETTAKATAERLLLLTDALVATVVGDSPGEMDGLLQSRQAVIDQLAAMDVDSAAAAVLELVAKSEGRLMAEMQRAQASVTSALIGTYSGRRNVRAYRGASTSVFQRTG